MPSDISEMIENKCPNTVNSDTLFYLISLNNVNSGLSFDFLFTWYNTFSNSNPNNFHSNCITIMSLPCDPFVV